MWRAFSLLGCGWFHDALGVSCKAWTLRFASLRPFGAHEGSCLLASTFGALCPCVRLFPSDPWRLLFRFCKLLRQDAGDCLSVMRGFSPRADTPPFKGYGFGVLSFTVAAREWFGCLVCRFRTASFLVVRRLVGLGFFRTSAFGVRFPPLLRQSSCVLRCGRSSAFRLRCV